MLPIDLYWEKVKIANFAVFFAIFINFVFAEMFI